MPSREERMRCLEGRPQRDRRDGSVSEVLTTQAQGLESGSPVPMESSVWQQTFLTPMLRVLGRGLGDRQTPGAHWPQVELERGGGCDEE